MAKLANVVMTLKWPTGSIATYFCGAISQVFDEIVEHLSGGSLGHEAGATVTNTTAPSPDNVAVK